MEYIDDRTEQERETHQLAWVGTDTFLSGWGEAAGGLSYAGWACTPATDSRVERWVRNRGDMQRVRLVALDGYRPDCAHCHIYVVNSGHPSIN